MGKDLSYTIGTDRTYRFDVEAIDFDQARTPQDITGAYVYFSLFRSGVLLLTKDNDPGGANVGIGFPDATNGQASVTLASSDLAADPGGAVDYEFLVRLDPTGADTGRQEIKGTMQLDDLETVVP